MQDDKDQISHDDEYTFPEDEFIQGEATGRPSIETNEALEQEMQSVQREKMREIYMKIRAILENRIVAVVIGLIIILIVVHFFFGGSKKKVAQPVSQQAVVQQPVQTQQPSSQVLDQLSGMQQSATSMQNSVSQLQNQVQALQANMTQVTQNRQDVENTLIALSQKLDQMQAEQQKMMQTAKKPVAAKKPEIVIPPVDFYTRAVVHNRAWVIGSNGVNASIAVGDHLQDYGKVVSINANNGVIKTSSGRTIRYAPGDR